MLLHKGKEIVRGTEDSTLKIDKSAPVYVVPAHTVSETDLLTISVHRGRTIMHNVQFYASDKISRLQATISTLFGVPTEHQTLMYCGGKLCNRTLKDARLVNNCSVRLMVSSEYKKQMSKSYMFTNPKVE